MNEITNRELFLLIKLVEERIENLICNLPITNIFSSTAIKEYSNLVDKLKLLEAALMEQEVFKKKEEEEEEEEEETMNEDKSNLYLFFVNTGGFSAVAIAENVEKAVANIVRRYLGFKRVPTISISKFSLRDDVVVLVNK